MDIIKNIPVILMMILLSSLQIVLAKPSKSSSINGAEILESDYDPDQDLELVGLIESRGFNVEEHSIETDDGYILTSFRIIDPKLCDEEFATLKPVILFHGLLQSSADYCVTSPHLQTNESKYGDTLAFALTQTKHYDVWLANARGTKYSLRHRNYNPDVDTDYWNFSWDHMATEDLPSTIEYVRNNTGSKTVGYVGFSQGTLIMFTLLSLQPRYADIIQPFIALAPITFEDNTESNVRLFVPFEPMLMLLGGKFMLSDELLKQFTEIVCTNTEIEQFCTNILFLIAGSDYKNFNQSRFGVYSHFAPETTSSWNLAHWAQLILTKRSIRFDYGSAKENRKHYGQSTPPDIPLENIPKHSKIALFQGINDKLAHQKDVQRTKNILKQNGVELIRDYYIPDPEWSHLDFVWGLHSGKYYINELIDVLDEYTLPK